MTSIPTKPRSSGGGAEEDFSDLYVEELPPQLDRLEDLSTLACLSTSATLCLSTLPACLPSTFACLSSGS